jgi:hypothetical protein
MGMLTKDVVPKFEEAELQVLEPLQESVLWRGRYPAPRSVKDRISKDQKALLVRTEFAYPDSQNAAISLYEKLEVTLTPRAPFEMQESLFGERKVGVMSKKK